MVPTDIHEPPARAIRHELKIWPDFFADVVSGAKKYEVRRNDRHFEVGDELLLREYNPHTQTYSGRTCFAKVTHITRGSSEEPVGDLLYASACVLGIEVIA